MTIYMEHTEKERTSGLPLAIGHLILLLIISTTFFDIVSSIIDISLFTTDDFFDIRDVRFTLATFIVMFPVFLGLIKYIEHKGGASRNVCNVAAFVSAAVILCSAIYTLFQFINGDLTSKFFLKLLVVLVMSALIFMYYMRTLFMQQLSFLVTGARYATVVLGVGTIIMGGAVIDVFHAKEVNQDQDQLRDINTALHTIRSVNASDEGPRGEYGKDLPASVEYTQQGDSFTLCGTLKRKVSFKTSTGTIAYQIIDSSWENNRACFTFDVMPQFKTWRG